MINMIEQFKSTAALADVATAAAKEKRSLTNKLAWLAFFILKDASIQERVALGRLVAKDAELQHHKATVSKGRSVLEYLTAGGAVEMKDGTTFSMEDVEGFSIDKLPEVALSSIYSAMKADKKEEDVSEQVQKEAEKMLSERHGLPTAELRKLLGGDYATEVQACVAEVQASMVEAKRAQAVAGVPSIIAALGELPAHAVQEVIDAAKALLAADNQARKEKVA